MNRQAVGKQGEEAAAAWLAKRGHIIVARNVRTPYGEIDIIAELEGVTIFVEVKTLTSSSAGFAPEVKINPAKQRHMIASAEYYCSQHEIDHWQIDAVAVEGDPHNEPHITHFPNIL